jgi:hypothetical protein
MQYVLGPGQVGLVKVRSSTIAVTLSCQNCNVEYSSQSVVNERPKPKFCDFVFGEQKDTLSKIAKKSLH